MGQHKEEKFKPYFLPSLPGPPPESAVVAFKWLKKSTLHRPAARPTTLSPNPE
jgi:hypothetical protein